MNLKNVEVISELIENQGIFESRGYSDLKVSKIIDGKPEIKNVRLPIKSTGVAEYQEKLKSKTPAPPTTKILVKKNSPEGKDLGLPYDRMVQTYDLTDERYVDDLEKFNQDMNWRIAIFALDVILKKTDGSLAETYEEKKRVLQSSNITGHHILKILKDVHELTSWAEDRQDFL